jgi:hypothetical protein
VFPPCGVAARSHDRGCRRLGTRPFGALDRSRVGAQQRAHRSSWVRCRGVSWIGVRRCVFAHSAYRRAALCRRSVLLVAVPVVVLLPAAPGAQVALGTANNHDDTTNRDLEVAHCVDVACSSATLATLDSAGSVGEYTSITIGADGLGLISYYAVTGEDLKVAHCGNPACSPFVVGHR